MTDIPDDVRDFLERVDASEARDLLAKYPRPQPEPAWEKGDTVLDGGQVLVFDGVSWIDPVDEGRYDGVHHVDHVIHAGRRVNPPQFAKHAAELRLAAADLEELADDASGWAPHLRRVARYLAGDNDG